jgi:hypothetical protein
MNGSAAGLRTKNCGALAPLGWQVLESSLPCPLSKLKVERADAGAMPAHDASTSLSTRVEPIDQGSAGQDQHCIVGRFSAPGRESAVQL